MAHSQELQQKFRQEQRLYDRRKMLKSIHLLVSGEHKERIADAAQRAGESISQYILNSILGRMEREKKLHSLYGGTAHSLPLFLCPEKPGRG